MNESIPNPDWREEVRKKVERAKSTAFSTEEVKKREEEQILLQTQLHKGEITSEEYKERKIVGDEGKAFFRTLPEFDEALKILGLSEEYRKYVLSHENAHRMVAEQAGVDAYYMMILSKNDSREDGRDWDVFIPAVYVNGLLDSPEIVKKIVEAPDDLSPNDKKIIGLD